MNKRLSVVFITFFVVHSFLNVFSQEVDVLPESTRHCAQCHGGKYYSFYNPITEQTQRKRMNPYLIIDTTLYKKGVHRFFACEDCHSSEYMTYPHNPELKLESKFSCLDCHGGDETFAKYQFDEIDAEVENSVHKTAFGMQFRCALCHDQHTYRPIARDTVSLIKDIIVADNQMCLSCHNDLSKYQILTDHSKPEILQTHSWLPNQELHFMHVRCIECHTPTKDTLMVSHRILPKEEAVHMCSDCHSTNSILRDKLYKYATKQARSDLGYGYYNSMMLNQSYVIGANRNKYLNIMSLVIIGITLLGIGIHAGFRIIKKK